MFDLHFMGRWGGNDLHIPSASSVHTGSRREPLQSHIRSLEGAPSCELTGVNDGLCINHKPLDIVDIRGAQSRSLSLGRPGPDSADLKALHLLWSIQASQIEKKKKISHSASLLGAA